MIRRASYRGPELPGSEKHYPIPAALKDIKNQNTQVRAQSIRYYLHTIEYLIIRYYHNMYRVNPGIPRFTGYPGNR
uniref:Uncharacterized protein n=1 Tax=Romanomermis culicivorax TaxID=13658 RepID=A0A915K9H3_ROMCU